MLRVGDIAPEIDVVATDGERFVLSEGSLTVVFFYPRAFTTGCTAETENFREHRNEIVLAGARLVGISTDGEDTQCRFAKELGLPFPLIADRSGIARAFGVAFLIGFARRVTFVIGPERRVEAVFQHATLVPFRPASRMAFVEEVLAFLHERRVRERAEAEALDRKGSLPTTR
jgi:thioredoxin-dependent peroxiredoxin